MGISKRHASADTRGDADLEQQRAPDGMPRGSRGMGWPQEAETVGHVGAGGGGGGGVTYVGEVAC